MTPDIILLIVSRAWQLLCRSHIISALSHGVAGLLAISSAAKTTVLKHEEPCRLEPWFH